MISIAIDGPAGAGKSSISKAVAKKLGYIYVDTGALYRAVGLKFSNCGVDRSLDCDIERILATTDVDIQFAEGEQYIFLDGVDVSDKIRTPDASMMASAISAKPEVRAFLIGMQRKIALENNVIMDGRDIGTVVLPNATVKIFLTASAEIRAERRYEELLGKGAEVKFQEVYNDMVKRDYNDTHREIAPLKQAEDAVLADTTNYGIEESVQLILNIVNERLENIN